MTSYTVEPHEVEETIAGIRSFGIVGPISQREERGLVVLEWEPSSKGKKGVSEKSTLTVGVRLCAMPGCSTPVQSHQEYCSAAHRGADWQAKNPERARARWRRQCAKRRAARRAA